MNAVSTTPAAPRRVMTGTALPLPGTLPVEVTCPSWCVVTVEQHAHDDAGSPQHTSAPLNPSFNAEERPSDGDGITGYYIGSQSDLTPADLRQLASDAIATAEWIEAHQ